MARHAREDEGSAGVEATSGLSSVAHGVPRESALVARSLSARTRVLGT
jgi:hypothetical protein